MSPQSLLEGMQSSHFFHLCDMREQRVVIGYDFPKDWGGGGSSLIKLKICVIKFMFSISLLACYAIKTINPR